MEAENSFRIKASRWKEIIIHLVLNSFTLFPAPCKIVPTATNQHVAPPHPTKTKQTNKQKNNEKSLILIKCGLKSHSLNTLIIAVQNSKGPNNDQVSQVQVCDGRIKKS